MFLNTLAEKPSALDRLPADGFQVFLAGLFTALGHQLEGRVRGAQGTDFMLVSTRNEGLGRSTLVVDCRKRGKDAVVGAAIARQLYEVVEKEHANAGVLVTTSTFSPEARSFAAKFRGRLHLLDRKAILGLDLITGLGLMG
jgi:hypothetical protein